MKDKNRAVSLVFCIFLIVSILLTGIGIFLLLSGSRFRQRAVEVDAIINEIQSYRDSGGDYRHRVYVNYTYGGNEYENIYLSEYSSNMYEGKKITLLVDPDDPAKISTGFITVFVGAIFAGMGVIFGLIGIIPLVMIKRRSAAKKKIISSGSFLWGTVEHIDYNTSYSVNGQHPYVVYCTYKDEYKDIVYRFKSENIWTNPEYALSQGSTVRIYVDKEDYSKYYVDVESVLQGKVINYT